MLRQDRIVKLSWLKPNPRNARTHSKQQIERIKQLMSVVGFTAPVITDEAGVLLAGHARLEAAKLLGLKELPAVVLSDLNDTQKRAILLADNRLAEDACWDRKALAVELPELSILLEELDLDFSLTGFSVPEMEQITVDFDAGADPAEDLDPAWSADTAVSRRGDVFNLGPHRVMCGSAIEHDDVRRLMAGKLASAAFLDPPYNVAVRSIGGRGRIKHAEFAMASGEMSSSEFVAFLDLALAAAVDVSTDAAVHFVCMDWNHQHELHLAAQRHYADQLNLVVWVKTNAGQGSFYRSQHELISVYRVGDAPHRNNVQLGRYGRNRSNVWRYPGVNTFRTGRSDDLALHPTVKPVAMVVDALKDCTRPSDIVLDTFLGSGTTLLAAERAGRVVRGMELEPRFVDTAIRRWQQFTGRDAIREADGQAFDDCVGSNKRHTPAVLCLPSPKL